MILIDVDDRILRKTATAKRQEAGRIDFAPVADEHHPFSVGDAQRGSVAPPCGVAAGAGQRIAPGAEHVAPIVRRLGCLDAVGLVPGVVPELRKGDFILLGPNPLLFDAASDRHEEKHRPHRDSFGREQIGNRVDLVEVAPHECCVHLDGHAQSAGVGQHPPGPLKAALPTAEGIVRGGLCAVETDTQPTNARGPGTLEGTGRGQGRGRRGQRDFEPPADGVLDQLEQVGPLQRVAPGQDDRRPARERGHLPEQRLRLVGGQFLRVGMLLGLGAAMLADQVTGQRDLVVEHQRVAAEIGRRIVAVGHFAYRRAKLAAAPARRGRAWQELALPRSETYKTCSRKREHATQRRVAFDAWDRG